MTAVDAAWASLIFHPTRSSVEVLAVDLTTHEVSIFRSVQDRHSWLGAIDYADGTFYLGRSQRVHVFTEEGLLAELRLLPEHNITWIAVSWQFACAAVNFDGGLCRIDREMGDYQRMLRDLDYPQYIEIVPVALKQPGR